MRITIVGGGKVGIALTRQLQHEGHEITVIDKNEAVINHIGNMLDAARRGSWPVALKTL